MFRLCCGKLRTPGIGSRQCSAAVFGSRNFCSRSFALLGHIIGGTGQFCAALLKPRLGGFGLIEHAQCAPLVISGGCNRPVRSDHRKLQRAKFCLNGLRRCFRIRCNNALARKFILKRGKAVLRLQPRGFSPPFTARDKAVPAAQRPRAGYQPFAGI